MQAFREAGASLRLPLEIHAADASWYAPAMHMADVATIIPSVAASNYISSLLSLVCKHRIDMLIPLIDTDLPKLSTARDRFQKIGCLAVISSAKVVGLCRDKLKTWQFLKDAGIDTPDTWTLDEALRRRKHAFPYFLKPREGSASKGSFKIRSLDELKTLGRRVPDAIVQEFVPGVEHTLDVYTGLDGLPRCVVPRRRLEVRGGEVVKAVVVKDHAMIDAGCQIACALQECRGVITIQLIHTPEGHLRVIEVNPRFGGGVPLAIHAGADFPKWLLQTAIGSEPVVRFDDYQDDAVMLRYDQSVFTKKSPGGSSIH